MLYQALITPMWLNYRHSEQMIKKLHSAGLGFYVREADTQQKLGMEYNYSSCLREVCTFLMLSL